MRDIGKNIRELRIKNYLTQDELAEMLFVTRQTVSNYETGKSRPDIDMLEKIAEVLNCEINHVLYGMPRVMDRKSEIRGLFIGLIICCVSGLPLLFEIELTRMARYWQSSVTITLRSLVLPLFLIALGWTVMRGIEVLSRQKPLEYKYSRHTHWIVFTVLLIYFVLILPNCYHFIKAHKVYVWLQSLSCIRPPYGINSSFSLTPHWLNMLDGRTMLFVANNKWMFFAAGLLLCLFKSKTKNIKTHLSLLIASLVLSVLLYFTSDSSFILEVENPEDFSDVPYGIVVEQWTES